MTSTTPMVSVRWRAEGVWCNARTSVAGFYRNPGLRAVGQELELPGIGPHSVVYWRSR